MKDKSKPMSIQEIAHEITAAVAEMSPEEKALVRQVLTWEFFHECEWTPADLEFLAEAGIKP